MSIPKGGRGKMASYKTIQVRCPEPVKDKVMQVIQSFHDGSSENLNTSIHSPSERYEIALKILAEYLQEKGLNESGSTRNWVEFNKLKAWLEVKHYSLSGGCSDESGL